MHLILYGFLRELMCPLQYPYSPRVKSRLFVLVSITITRIIQFSIDFTDFFWAGRTGCQTSWEFPSRGMMHYTLHAQSSFRNCVFWLPKFFKTNALYVCCVQYILLTIRTFSSYFSFFCKYHSCSHPLPCPKHIHNRSPSFIVRALKVFTNMAAQG
jgi:hypothetical protein